MTLEEAIARLPIGITAGVKDALKGEFVRIVPAPRNPDTETDATDLETTPEVDPADAEWD